jgi:hypothetical protein
MDTRGVSSSGFSSFDPQEQLVYRSRRFEDSAIKLLELEADRERLRIRRVLEETPARTLSAEEVLKNADLGLGVSTGCRLKQVSTSF